MGRTLSGRRGKSSRVGTWPRTTARAFVRQVAKQRFPASVRAVNNGEFGTHCAPPLAHQPPGRMLASGGPHGSSATRSQHRFWAPCSSSHGAHGCCTQRTPALGAPEKGSLKRNHPDYDTALAELKRRTRLAAHSKAVARSRLVLGGNGRLVFEKRHDAEVGSSISSILRMKGSPPLSIAGAGCTRRRSLAPIATTGFGSSWKGVQRLLCARRGHRASIGWARSLHLSSDGER